MLDITVNHYMALSAVLFGIGLVGILAHRRNIILILMSFELMLLAVNIQMVAFSNFLHDLAGQIFTMFILTVAAAEVAIGLAILVSFYRQKNTINVHDINQLNG